MIGWNKTAWGNNTVRSKFAALLEARAFEDNTFVSNSNIIFDVGGINRAASTNLNITSDVAFSGHASRDRSSSMNYRSRSDA